MKRFFYSIMCLALIIGISCKGPDGAEGPVGPVGPQGPQGAQGLPGTPSADGSGKIYDIYNFQFNAENNFEQGFAFTDLGIEVKENDLMFVYRAYNILQDEGSDELLFVWDPLPVTVFDSLATFQYKFIHTFEVMIIYMEGDVKLETIELDPYFTDDQVFRVVVVPGEIVPGPSGKSSAPVDYTNYKEVVNYFHLDEKNIIDLKIK